MSLTDYVAIDIINFKTYSYKLEHLLLGICAELDAVFREYTKRFTEKMDIGDYKRDLLKKIQILFLQKYLWKDIMKLFYNLFHYGRQEIV